MADSLKVLIVMLPVIVAGVTHSLAIRFNLLPALAKPLDFGLCLHGKPLLGANKTFRGPAIMIAVAAISAWALSFALRADWLPPGFGFMLQPGPAFVLGAVMGFGYGLGELPNSLIKRRLGIAAGGRAGGIAGGIGYVCDQVDSVTGVILLLWLIYAPSASIQLALLAAGSLVHVVFDQCLYVFGVKRSQGLSAGRVRA
jgi:hypothetical protein